MAQRDPVVEVVQPTALDVYQIGEPMKAGIALKIEPLSEHDFDELAELLVNGDDVVNV